MAFNDLPMLAKKVHGLAISSADWSVWCNYGRQECQEAFRSAAKSLGVQDKTNDMGFVVIKCLSLSGYGT